MSRRRIAFFGSSLVSAYWNGAATYYRRLLGALSALGHGITFYEPDAFERQRHRDIADPAWARVVVYPGTEEGALAALADARGADLVVKASGGSGDAGGGGAAGASDALEIVILGLSITSSWGNGHATTYRGLVRALAQRGHRVLFLERDVPWYAAHRDLPAPPYATVRLYRGLRDLDRRFRARVRRADAAIVGSYVRQGAASG